MQEKDLKKYQNSFNEDYFKECLIEKYDNSNNLNPRYYEKTINNWYEQRCKELSNNNKLKEYFTLLRNYLLDIKFLFTSIIELYQAIERYNNIRVRLNRININEHHVITIIEQLQTYNLVVRENLSLGFDNAGINIKRNILLRLDDMYMILKQVFHIDILKSPLKKIYQETYCIIENSTKQIESVKSVSDLEYKEYFEVTTLFAQGFIKKIKKEDKYDPNIERCSFKDKNFINYLELQKYLNENIITKNKIGKEIKIRQYLRHTLSDNKAERNNKNLYFKSSIINKTYEYCKRKGIKMTNEFQRKRIELNN
jgi:hypothetical protein